MVLHRMREHVASHNWFAVGVDLGIVVAGVFLGTQANNWNAARIERAEANAYREQIIDDLKSNEVDIAARRAYFHAVREHALAALAATEARSEPRGELFLIHAYHASQVWFRPLIRTGYDEMTGAGLSNSISDRQTRSQLTAFYTQIPRFDVMSSNMTSYRERLRRVMPYEVQYAVNHHCSDQVATTPGGVLIATLPDTCLLDLDQSTVSLAVARIEGANLGEDLTRLIADIDQKISGFDRFGRLARQIRLLLEARYRA